MDTLMELPYPYGIDDLDTPYHSDSDDEIPKCKRCKLFYQNPPKDTCSKCTTPDPEPPSSIVTWSLNRVMDMPMGADKDVLMIMPREGTVPYIEQLFNQYITGNGGRHKVASQSVVDTLVSYCKGIPTGADKGIPTGAGEGKTPTQVWKALNGYSGVSGPVVMYAKDIDVLLSIFIDLKDESKNDYRYMHAIMPSCLDPWNVSIKDGILQWYYLDEGKLRYCPSTTGQIQSLWYRCLHHEMAINEMTDEAIQECVICLEDVWVDQDYTRCISCGQFGHTGCYMKMDVPYVPDSDLSSDSDSNSDSESESGESSPVHPVAKVMVPHFKLCPICRAPSSSWVRSEVIPRRKSPVDIRDVVTTTTSVTPQ